MSLIMNNAKNENQYNFPKDFWDSENYDSLRRQLIPSFDLLYSTGANIVASHCHKDAKVLDLGAGTGLFTHMVSKKLPGATFTLLDASREMLQKASSRMEKGIKCQFLEGDFSQLPPLEPYDAVISALAIHHLTHEHKQALFRQIAGTLKPGGLFVNVEQLLGPTQVIEKFYDDEHERHVHDMKTDPAEWAKGRERMKIDIPADLLSQLEWLRSAGFAHAECLAKDGRFATYAAWMP